MLKTTYHPLSDFFRVQPNKNGNSLIAPALIKVEYTNVLCITSKIKASNKVKLITAKNQELYDNRTLKEFCNSYNFFQRISKCCVVNVMLVDKLSDNLSYIWLDKIKLQVSSKRYKKELQNKLNEYL